MPQNRPLNFEKAAIDSAGMLISFQIGGLFQKPTQ
jgi:hypothetical protein